MKTATEMQNDLVEKAKLELEKKIADLAFTEKVTGLLPLQPRRVFHYPLHGREGAADYEVKSLADAQRIFHTFLNTGKILPMLLGRYGSGMWYAGFFHEAGLPSGAQLGATLLARTFPWTSLEAKFTFFYQLDDQTVIDVNIAYPSRLLGWHAKDNPRARTRYKLEWVRSKYAGKLACVLSYGGSDIFGPNSGGTPHFGFANAAEVDAFLGQEVDNVN